ncbi:hypothetical protein DICVIV_07275 [Dictyocaulus viviparus]|uniref:Uncharacterized protein n=1 Tax=Dictyocaulus viviparus TaxID=29172 RepID=A0A0D8XS90_DICVI|nr:hypothetical protein DICVIV_07275 [Dictyocaulus viviparus]
MVVSNLSKKRTMMKMYFVIAQASIRMKSLRNSLRERRITFESPVVVYLYVELINSNRTTLFDTCHLTTEELVEIVKNKRTSLHGFDLDGLSTLVVLSKHIYHTFLLSTIVSHDGDTKEVLVSSAMRGMKSDIKFGEKSRCLVHVDDRNFKYGNWSSSPSSKIFTCDIVETLCVSGFCTEGYLHPPGSIGRSPNHGILSDV